MARLDFNASEVDPAVGFDPIPAGKYLAVITESEMRPTKAGTGQYLQLTLDVVEGQYRGRKLWARLNLQNPSQMAMKIAQAELSAICRAVGVLQPRDSVDLHNLPLQITVGCKKRDDTGDIVNEIKGYAKKEAVTGAPQQATDGNPPWRRS